MTAGLETEIPRFRVALRDLVALSTMSATWVGRDPPTIAAALADVLVWSLRLDFAFVRLSDPAGGDAAEVTRTSGEPVWPGFAAWLRGQGRDGSPISRRQVVSDIGDPGVPRRGIVIPIGIDGAGGLVAGASDRPDFPTEMDQLLLSVAANQAATAFQNARLIHERQRAEAAAREARDDLERKVAARTAELRESERFLESLDRVNRAMQGTDDVEQIMSDVLDAMLEIFACDRAWLLYPCDPAAPSCRVMMERTVPEYPGAYALASGGELPVNDDVANVFGEARTSGGPVRFGPGTAHPMPRDVMERLSIRSAIAVAVDPRVDQPYLLGLHQCGHRRDWTDNEQRLLREIGRRLGDGLSTLLMFRDLRISEGRLAAAQRISHVGYWERDLATDRLTLSDETYRIFGMHGEDRPTFLSELIRRIHPDDRPAMTRALEAAIAGGPRYEAEYRVTQPTGELRILHSQGDVMRDADGRPYRIRGTVQDVTERRRADELTAHIFATMADAAYVIGPDYRIRRVNRVCAQEWRRAPEEIVGMHVADLVGGPAFEERFKGVVDRCLAGEVVRHTVWHDFPSGRRYRSGILSPLRVAGLDRIDAALVIVRDLTDHMQAIEALQESQAELARVARVSMLGEITASIAHEVNQPLTAMVINGNACRRWLTADPPKVDEALDAVAHVVADAARAGKIIHGIHALVRRGEPERRLLDVNEIIREALEFTRATLERKGIVIQLELTEPPPPVRGDRVQLQQVLVNLLLNAGDAMTDIPAGARTLTIVSRREEGAGVMVEVRDCGKGIDPAVAGRVFEALFTTKAGGLGMGLAISRSIIAAHGGHIWAAPADPRGTAMCFALPSVDATRADATAIPDVVSTPKVS